MGSPAATIGREQQKLLLAHQQDELDTCRAYLYLAGLATEDESTIFRELADDENHHARVFQGITGEELQPRDGKRRRIALLRKLLSRNRLLKHLADDEQESAVRYESLLAEFPELEAVKRDELRHFDTLLGMMD